MIRSAVLFLLILSVFYYFPAQNQKQDQNVEYLLKMDRCEEVISKLSPKVKNIKVNNIPLYIQYINALELCDHNAFALEYSMDLIKKGKLTADQKIRLYLIEARLYEKSHDSLNTRRSLIHAASLMNETTPDELEQIYCIRMSSFYRVMTSERDSARYYAQMALQYPYGEIGSAYFLNAYLSNCFSEKEQYFKKALEYFKNVKNENMIGSMHLELAKLYKQNRPQDYEDNFHKGIKYLSETNSIGYRTTYYRKLVDYYREKGQIGEALLYKDSLCSSELKASSIYNAAAVRLIKDRYAEKEYERSILELNTSIKKNTIRSNIYLIVAVFFILLVFVVIHLLIKNKKKGHIITVKNADLKKNNEELQESLEYNSVLMRETNHRVRNNLMLLISVLQIEISKSSNKLLKEKLMNIERRIYNISVIHKYIYYNGKDSYVDINELLEEIIVIQKENLVMQRAENITLQCDHITLPMSKITPLILIVNELVNNSIKYALKRNKDYIRISLHKRKHAITISVTDSGPGYNTELSQSENTVGLFLIKILVKQLKGTTEYTQTEKEFTTTIKIPADDKKDTDS